MLLASVAALVAIDAAWLAVDPAPRAAELFQGAVGSVGLGAAVSGAWSTFGFDPRLEPSCENELWPIPGLACPNPYHGAGVFDPPPLREPRK